MNESLDFEDRVKSIQQREVVVLRDVRRFPTMDKEFSVPHMVVVLCLRGSAKALYDMHEIEFSKNELAVVLPEHLLRPLKISTDYLAILIVLSNTFVREFQQDSITQDHIKYHTTPSCKVSERNMQNALKIIDALEFITEMSPADLTNRHSVLLMQMNIIFELINYVRKQQQDANYNKSHETDIFFRFCDLLSKNYRLTHSVCDYAEMLGLSPRYFSSRLVPKVIGMTAGQWIDNYMVTQIKKVLLTRSDLSIKQMALLFNFGEMSSFCRYFKNLTGMSLVQYRKMNKEVNGSEMV